MKRGLMILVLTLVPALHGCASFRTILGGLSLVVGVARLVAGDDKGEEEKSDETEQESLLP